MKAAALFPSKLACCLSLALGAFALTPPAWSQTAPSPAPASSNMDGELFYQLLVGELQVRGGDPGAGYSMVLDAARRTQNPQLYRRAVEIALQARSGEAALSAANAWGWSWCNMWPASATWAMRTWGTACSRWWYSSRV